ncbi:MAG: ABC transporter substrate-binding protein [Gemmatimonadota bacterium]
MRSARLARPACAGFWLLLLLLSSCAKSSGDSPGPQGAGGAGEAEGARRACVLLADAAPVDSLITVALSDEVSFARAPHARNAGERMLFRHLYETLIDVDCDGNVRPGLAESWQATVDGRRWSLQLRDDARFSDGARVSAADVLASWTEGSAEAVEKLTALGAPPESIAATAERVVTIVFDRAHSTLPRSLADPDLAVVKRETGRSRPLGTGPYRISGVVEDVDASASTWLLKKHGARWGRAAIEFSSRPGVDPRDLFDVGAGVDLLVESDPKAVDYARTQPRLRTFPLPWDLTYVLLSFSRVDAVAASDLRLRIDDEAVSDELRAALARDVVREDARGSEPPYWWAGPSACAADDLGRDDTRAGASRAEVRPRVVYPFGDFAAKGLAERLVALVVSGAYKKGTASARSGLSVALEESRVDLVAVGLAPTELVAAFRTASELAYVVPIPRMVLDACQALAELIAGGGSAARSGESRAVTLTPLVDTRSYLIVRGQLPEVRFDWDATPLLFQVSR